MKILIFHQSADLYGSDKTLLDLCAHLDPKISSVTVLVPVHGPLVPALQQAGCTVHVVPLLRASRATFSPKNIFALPVQARQSLQAIGRVISADDVDIVHSNTLAVLSGAVWAKVNKKPHLWHVHEIIDSPSIVKETFALLLTSVADEVVCNSHATLQHWSAVRPKLRRTARVIWNGTERPSPVDAQRARALRQSIGISPETLCVTVVGRINRWKGQGLLVRAATALWNQGQRNVHYLFVGSPPHGQEHIRTELEQQIAASPAHDAISVLDFQDDIWAVWDASDIAVVPSTDPEPFGLVAVEAMLAGKPLVAAGHGGLIEIVEKTGGGLLFEPGNVDALAQALKGLLDDSGKRIDLGRRGKDGARRNFSIEQHVAAFQALYDAMCR